MCNGIHALVAAGVDSDSVVMVHDAVRPLISHDTITNNITVCRQYGNAITVIYSNEAYMRVTGSIEAAGFAMREDFMRAQTPHTFHLADLSALIDQADAQGITCSQSLFTLANELGHKPLYIAQGNMLNFKITLPIDVEIYNRLRSVNYD